MKKNRTILIVVIVLALISGWLLLQNSKSTLHKGLRDFAIKDTAEVTKIFLADKNDHTVLLEKKHRGVWQLNHKFFARNDAVNLLLKTMKEVEVKNPIGKNALQTIIGQLAAKSVKVEVYKGVDLIKLYYVGSPTADMMGTYMLLADTKTLKNSPVPYVTYIPGFDGFLTPRYFVEENEWRDRTIFHYLPPEIKSIRVEYPGKHETGFEVINLPGTKFEVKSFAGNNLMKSIDTLAVMQYVSYFQDIQFELFESFNKSVKDSIIHSTPLAIFTLTDIKGNENTVKLFYKAPGKNSLTPEGKPSKYDVDRLFALINEGKDLTTAQFVVFGKLLQTSAYFTPKSIVKK